MKVIFAPLLLFATASPAPVPLTATGQQPFANAPLRLLASADPHPNLRYKTKAYDASANGMAQLDAALKGAQQNNSNLVVVLGANWCHDSAALANDIGQGPLGDLFAAKLKVIFIDVGKPKIPGKGRNLDVPKRFGIETLAGTPTVLILSPDGKMLNSVEDAKSWRNAASRKPGALLAYFTKAAERR